MRSGIERVNKASKEGGIMGKIDTGRAALSAIKNVKSALR